MVPVARRNLLDEKGRFAISVAGVGVAILLILIVLALYRGWSRTGSILADVPGDIWVVQTVIPARVSVKVGETVLIKNSETAIHTGNINGENVTGNMKKGANIAWTAKTPGEYAVTCEYHPQMKATIIVTS